MYLHSSSSVVNLIKRINPIARLFAYTRRKKQVVPPKKGKGSYKRKGKGVDKLL